MKIIISNIIDVVEPTTDIIKFCKKDLTYVNPDIAKKKRMGFYTYGMDKEIKLYNIYNNHLYLPIGEFEKLFRYHPIKEDYIDCTTTRKANIKSNMVLRDYQKPVLQATCEKINGIIIAPCGCGKTSMMLETIANLNQKSLWICNTMELLNQAKDRCTSTMECTTSTITNGVVDFSGDVVFATVQTLVRAIDKQLIPQDTFGCVVVDEVQLLSCNPESIQMFRTSIEWFSAKYKFACTATLHRADGLHKCIKKIVGDVIYKIEKIKNDYACIYDDKVLMKFPVDKFQVPIHVKAIETNYNIIDKEIFSSNGGTIQFASLISDLAMNEERNKQLIDTLKTINGSTLILSDRVEQLKILSTYFPDGVFIDGTTPKKIRKQAIDDVRAGNIKYLFASYAIAKAGLDIPILSNLVMATPVKDFAIVQQSCGRIQRPYGDKKIAYVYDFVDDVGMLHNFYAKRRSTYRKNDWKIDNKYLGGS